MLVAYIACMTLLPALIRVLEPPPEPRPLGYAAMAPVDRFLARHRIAVIAATVLVAVAGLPLLFSLRFDFNPLHLRNPQDEAVATYLELSRNSSLAGNPAEVLSPSAEAAAAVAARLSALPEVAQARTIESFVPQDQDEKLPVIAAAATALDASLNPRELRPAPSDAENIAALKDSAQRLDHMTDGAGAASAKRLAAAMDRLANASPSVRKAVETAFIEPLGWDLDELRRALHPDRVTRPSVPEAVQRDWISPDGQFRTEAVPKGDQDDNDNLHRFADAVLAAEPAATGPAIGTAQWSQTMITAFIEAGALALAVIALLLWAVLRRLGDMLLTLIPLLVAALVTLEICALIRFPLNYANIMALPVLLGIGVAFKIYYITAWRAGESQFLQSVLTRAVFFSALMTATAFGSLWISGNPGISTMGGLLALSLACTLASAALFQPALMGAPRQPGEL
jgi:hopanoid biosynthesis associated RND transporter like protein HpnN